jgi:hypothetical protein
MKNKQIITRIRTFLLLFIVLLLLSGITAFPIRTEIAFLNRHLHSFPVFFGEWISRLNGTITATPEIMLYGTDWLAFAHIIISLFFIPVFLDPVKHKANVAIGMAACLGVFPLAFICGPVRGIPLFHQLLDCGFGIGGMIFLLAIYRWISRLEKEKQQTINT